MASSRPNFSVKPSVASPILMEQVAQHFRPEGSLRRRLFEAGANEDLLAHLAVAIPGKTLETFRIVYVGQAINARMGRDLTGLTFGNILEISEDFRDCLSQFQDAIGSNEKIIARHCFDFSDKWMIEYSRIIYPIIGRKGFDCALGYYTFHENNLDGRYF